MTSSYSVNQWKSKQSRAQVSGPQLGQWCLLAAKQDALPWLACAGNFMARKVPSLLKTTLWVWAETYVKDYCLKW